MSFLHRVAGFSLRDRVRSLDIQEELGVEPLRLCFKRTQLMGYVHLAKLPPGFLPGEDETQRHTKEMELER